MNNQGDYRRDGTARLAIVGDVMLGRGVSDEIPHRDPKSFWGDVLPVLTDADAVLANLECAISGRGKPWTRTEKVFHFRAIPSAIDVLKAANVRYVSLANNHVLDFEEEAFLDTIDLLDAAGIAHAGAGRTLAGAQRPAQFDANGLSIKAFSVVDHERPFAAQTTAPGTCFVDPGSGVPLWPDADAIAAAKPGLVVVSAHMGPNMVSRPSASLRAAKTSWLAAGADIVIGHSAHVFQGIETAGRSVILHDTGDFIDDYAVDATLRNDWSFLFLLDVDPTGVNRILLRPVRLGFAEVNLARDREFEAICARMVALSRDFGTTLHPCAEGLELALGEPAK